MEHKIKTDQTAYSLLRDELNELRGQLKALEEEIADFAKKLADLRKDELSAREKVQELSANLSEAIKSVRLSNIPGIPEKHSYLLRDAGESIETVKAKLSEQPLDIPVIKEYLNMAVKQVESAVDATYELIETAILAEKSFSTETATATNFRPCGRGSKKRSYLSGAMNIKPRLNKRRHASKKWSREL